MTTTDEVLLDVRTTPDREIEAKISRTLIESAWVLSTIVRSQACALKARADAKIAAEGDAAKDAAKEAARDAAEARPGKKSASTNTGPATRELVSLVLAASRTMEMKHRIDAVAGPADKLTRDEARKLLDLTDDQIIEFIAQRKAAAESKSGDRGVAGGDPVLLDGARP